MSDYILYDNNGVIVQQGNAPDANIRIIKATLTDLRLLVVPQKLSNTEEYTVENEVLVPRAAALEPDLHYTFVRNQSYNLGEQLDLLYKDIQAGLFGAGAKSGGFATYIQEIKQRYPKV
jgi:hypothetical protein